MKLEITLIVFLIIIVLFIAINFYYQDKRKKDAYISLNMPNEEVEERTFTTEIIPTPQFTEKELKDAKRYLLGNKGCYINKPLTEQPINALPFNAGLKECIPQPQMEGFEIKI